MFVSDIFKHLTSSPVNVQPMGALPNITVPPLPFRGLTSSPTTSEIIHHGNNPPRRSSTTQHINHSLHAIMSNIFSTRGQFGIDYVDSAAQNPPQLPLPTPSGSDRRSLELSAAEAQNTTTESSSGNISTSNDARKPSDASWNDANGTVPSTSSGTSKSSEGCRKMGIFTESVLFTQEAPRHCHICGYTAEVHEKFIEHLKNHYDHQCPKCDYSSRTEGRLRRHMESFHSAVPPENFSGKSTRSSDKPKAQHCKQCDYVAETKTDYWNHQRTHIKAERILECSQCPFVTEYRHHLDYHVRNHMGSKPYKCSKCNYECVNKSMLNSHMKSHTNIHQYRCADCSYATKYCHSLKMHLFKHGHTQAVVLNTDGTLPDREGVILTRREAPPTRIPALPAPPTPTSIAQPNPPMFPGFPPITKHDPLVTMAAFMLSLRQNQQSHPDPPNDEALDLSDPRKMPKVEEKTTTPGQPLECPFCEIIFKNEDLYRIHIQYHNPREPFLCNRCGVLTRGPVEFFNHLNENEHIKHNV